MRKLKRHPDEGNLFKKILLAAVIFCFAAVAFLVYFCFFTDALSVSDIRMRGNSSLPEEYLRGLSGVESYENLLTLPVRVLDKNLRMNPWISDVDIERELPHTLIITVKEREPLAVVDYGGACFLVDEEAFVLEKVEAHQHETLPRINAGNTRIPSIGLRLPSGAVSDCVEVIREMPLFIRSKIQFADPLSEKGLIFSLRTGYEIIYGGKADYKQKNKLVEAIVKEIQRSKRNVAYLDVSVVDCPVVGTKP
ncbi:MAG: FtsQ-type POTRA domain-containing protein [Actinomycetota bacterium]|nr:FtsQ-type POTRA domain-containing protein [Actinomycetota bacterium]